MLLVQMDMYIGGTKMFYYKIFRDGEIVGYAQMSNECLFETHIPITQEEFEEAIKEDESIELDRKTELELAKANIEAEIAQLQEEEDEQQIIVKEQASLLALRNQKLNKAEAAYVENRLDAISDYWDSKEGQVATYGTY